MKYLIPLLFITNLAFAQLEEYRIPNSCLDTQRTITTTTTTTVTNDNSEQRRAYIEATKKVMKILSMIIDIKVEINEFMLENGDLYGKYASTKLLKEEIQKELEDIKKKKDQLNVNYLENINSISSSLPESEVEKIIKQLSKTLKKELNALSKRERKLQRRLKRINKKFARAYKKWAPFDEHIRNLEGLRDSLIEDLKKLKEVLNMSEDDFDVLVTNITTTRPAGSINIFCDSLQDRIQRMIDEINRTRIQPSTPVLINPNEPRPIGPDYDNHPLINPGIGEDLLSNYGVDGGGFSFTRPPVNE